MGQSRSGRAGPHCAGAYQSIRLHNLLRGITPSDPWEWELYARIHSGELPYRSDIDAQEFQLLATGAFPPGGVESAMVLCRHCLRWTPPQAVGNTGTCYECFFERLPDKYVVHIPSLPTLDRVFKRAELGGWLGVDGFDEIKRVRRLEPVESTLPMFHQAWAVVESIEGDDGFRKDVAVFPVAGTPEAA